jgi:hypothetical protein
LLIVSVLTQCLILLGHPNQDEIEHKLSIFNELMVSLYLYLLLCLTDFQPIPSRDIFGWSLLSVVLISVLVNFLKFFYLIGRDLRLIWRQRKLKKIREQRQAEAERRKKYEELA